MEISREFIDKFLDIVNQQSNSMVRSKIGYGKFVISEIMMDYRNKETDYLLEYIELDRVDRSKEIGKHLCFKKKFIGNDSTFRDAFYQSVVEWFIFSTTIPSEYIKLIGASDLINYGLTNNK